MKALIASTAVSSSSRLYNMYKQAQLNKEEVFKREYLCEFIGDKEGEEMAQYPYFTVDWSLITKECKAEVNEDMKLGEIVVEKNGLENIFDGELVMLVPGYELEDFVVSRQDKSLRIVTQKDNGIKKNNLKDFVLVKDYSVKCIGYNVANGVFKLKVEYDLDANVKVDKSL